jgi:sugar fermentation stimulation protein A
MKCADPTNLVSPALPFPPNCQTGHFLRREKRFLVEVKLPGGLQTWVHCNNSGSMLGLLREGCEVFVSPALRPGRRLDFTLEMVNLDGFWVGVNTLTPNRLLKRAWELGCLPEVAGYGTIRPEVAIGTSRLDAAFDGPAGRLWVEAKNVTLVEEEVAYFPDAVTQRGQKHLTELMKLAEAGDRVACFYLVQRPDARCFGPADFIDPDFARLFEDALRTGVEVWPYRATLSTSGIALGERLPLSGAIPSSASISG